MNPKQITLLLLLILGTLLSSLAGQELAASSCNAGLLKSTDVGTQINNCVRMLGGKGTVYVPAGTYKTSTTVKINVDGVALRGAGYGATTLVYDGTGAAIDLNGDRAFTRTGLYDIGVVVTNPSAIGVKAGGLYQTIQNVYVEGTGAYLMYITGNSTSHTTSFSTHLINVDLESFTNVGLMVEHAVDVYVDQLRVVAKQNSTTALNVVIDSGTSGFYLTNATTGYGQHSLLVRNSAGGPTYGYNASPQYLFFTHFVGDSPTGGDSILFDSTLGSNFVSATFTNSWSGGAGRIGSSCVTNSANGIHISGGAAINFTDHRVLANCANGMLIDSANGAQNIHISGGGCNIFDNNQANNPDAHGIYINTLGNLITISDCTIGNGLQVAGGHQKYGVKAASFSINSFKLQQTDLTFNEIGPFLNLMRNLIYYPVISGNTPPSCCGQ
jgi:hypothetical protein